MNYAYKRISTDKQEQDRQELILQNAGVPIENQYGDVQSGTIQAIKRNGFKQLLSVIKEGDTIYFESLSRLGRSVIDLHESTTLLVKKYKVKVVFLKENIVINPSSNGMDAVSNLFFMIMAAMAQFERDLISQRTKEGLQAKKENGVKLGQPFKDLSKVPFINDFYEDWKNGFSYGQLIQKYNISRGTVSRYISKYCRNRLLSEED